MKIVKKKNQLKIVIFTAVENHCILHGRVFVMLASHCAEVDTRWKHDDRNFQIRL